MSTFKRVRFEESISRSNEDPGSEETANEDNRSEAIPFGKKFKHSLDSDEEDDEVDQEKYQVLDASELEDGEKDSIARVENNVKFTAFNMTEEMEEGHFDKDGTYIFRKDKDEIKDAWVQDIDNCKIADVTKIRRTEDDQDSNDVPLNTTQIYKTILTLIGKDETVGKAIRRLGASLKEMRVKKRKDKSAQLTADIADMTKQLEKLTELADQLVIGKDMDIYEKKYEAIEAVLAERSNDMFDD